MSKSILFHRDFRGFTGGHLKVWHYFQHLQGSAEFHPRIHFSPETVWTEENPWFAWRESAERSWDPHKADILFLAGVDWLVMRDKVDRHPPVVNLVQHVRHAQKDDIRFSFLTRRAIRICVSEEVACHIRETGRVNGPVFTIPNAIDIIVPPTPVAESERDIPVFVAGMKNPEFARHIGKLLSQEGIPAQIATGFLPRQEFLARLGRTRIAVLLPNVSEGFYLPALEAMALGAVVVCPDCVGNRGFCKDGYNCFLPAYSVKDVSMAVHRACALLPVARTQLAEAARHTADMHGLARERDEFLRIMRNLDQLW
jgi:hypothetical protein